MKVVRIQRVPGTMWKERMFIESFPGWLIDLFNQMPDRPEHPYSRIIAESDFYFARVSPGHTFEYAE